MASVKTFITSDHPLRYYNLGKTLVEAHWRLKPTVRYAKLTLIFVQLQVDVKIIKKKKRLNRF